MKLNCNYEMFSDPDFEELWNLDSGRISPEHQLLCAMIERSTRDAMGNDPIEAPNAIKWMFEKSEVAPHAFSFQWICEHLDVNGEKVKNMVRQRLLRNSRETESASL